MYIITISGREEEGAYSVTNEDGEQVLYLFQEEDDATRFAMLLEESDSYPEMNVMEVEDSVVIEACEVNDYNYVIITKDDIVIPPEETDEEHDFI